MPKISKDKLLNTSGHRIRKALIELSGGTYQRINPISKRANKTHHLNYISDLEFNPEQDDFIMEIIRFQRVHHRKPNLIDGFRIAKAMGYRRVA